MPFITNVNNVILYEGRAAIGEEDAFTRVSYPGVAFRGLEHVITRSILLVPLTRLCLRYQIHAGYEYAGDRVVSNGKRARKEASWAKATSVWLMNALQGMLVVQRYCVILVIVIGIVWKLCELKTTCINLNLYLVIFSSLLLIIIILSLIIFNFDLIQFIK